MKLTKLNKDSSWLIETDKHSILIDPWFSEYQVDIATWFSKQYHISEQPKLSDFTSVDYIFISNPFTDHCNKETLLQLNHIPIISSNDILKQVQNWNLKNQLIELKDAPFSISRINAPMLDLTHHAYILELDNKKIMYAPHGFKNYHHEKVDILISTSTTYRLPFWLGGTVNLGLKKLEKLIIDSGCNVCLTTHDEAKKGTGLVEKLAKKKYTVKFENPKIKMLEQGESLLL